jgi:hypothetical protein
LNTTNPKINGSVKTVEKLLDDMPKTNPAAWKVYGTIPVPDWRGFANHFQGIAPINGAVKITGQISASASRWWCASFVEETNQSKVTDVWGTPTYDHAGGIQRLGDLLPVPLENNEGLATVAFYDVSRSPGDMPIYEVHVGGKASAVAITNYTDSAGVEQAVLLIYRYDPMKFYIYRCRVEQAGANNWVYIGETNELFSDDQFQCFSFVTQTSAEGDIVYLLGFREDEELHLYSMNTGSDYGKLAHVKTYTGWKGSQWRYGAGLQICSSTMMRILGCSEDPSGDEDDYEFTIYFWG